jgi:hypothetical protein
MNYAIVGLKKNTSARWVSSLISRIEYIFGEVNGSLEVNVTNAKTIYIYISNVKKHPDSYPFYITKSVYIEPVRNEIIIPIKAKKLSKMAKEYVPKMSEYIQLPNISTEIERMMNRPVIIDYLIELRENPEVNRDLIYDIEVELLVS